MKHWGSGSSSPIGTSTIVPVHFTLSPVAVCMGRRVPAESQWQVQAGNT